MRPRATRRQRSSGSTATPTRLRTTPTRRMRILDPGAMLCSDRSCNGRGVAAWDRRRIQSRICNAPTRRCGRDTPLAVRQAAGAAACRTPVPLAQTHLPHQVHSSAARQPKTRSTSRSPKHHPTCPNSARRVDPVARQAAASSRTPTTRSTKSPRRKHPLLPHRPPWQPSLRSLLLYPWACAGTPSLAFSLSKALEW
jgi:hypothetical protein